MEQIGRGSNGRKLIELNSYNFFSILYSDFKARISTVNNPVLPHLSEFIDLIQKAGKCMKVRNMRNKSGHKKRNRNGGMMNSRQQNLRNTLYSVNSAILTPIWIYMLISQLKLGLKICFDQSA